MKLIGLCPIELNVLDELLVNCVCYRDIGTTYSLFPVHHIPDLHQLLLMPFIASIDRGKKTK